MATQSDSALNPYSPCMIVDMAKDFHGYRQGKYNDADPLPPALGLGETQEEHSPTTCRKLQIEDGEHTPRTKRLFTVRTNPQN